MNLLKMLIQPNLNSDLKQIAGDNIRKEKIEANDRDEVEVFCRTCNALVRTSIKKVPSKGMSGYLKMRIIYIIIIVWLILIFNCYMLLKTLNLYCICCLLTSTIFGISGCLLVFFVNQRLASLIQTYIISVQNAKHCLELMMG